MFGEAIEVNSVNDYKYLKHSPFILAGNNSQESSCVDFQRCVRLLSAH